MGSIEAERIPLGTRIERLRSELVAWRESFHELIPDALAWNDLGVGPMAQAVGALDGQTEDTIAVMDEVLSQLSEGAWARFPVEGR